MIISRTPYRISFLGGGTDYPAWYRENKGAIFATTIDKYSYVTCRYLPPFFEHKSRIVYSKIEIVKSNAQIKHPAVRGALEFLKLKDGVEIHYDGDLPARTGLGSSSSFTVGLLHALYELIGVVPDKARLGKESIFIEQEILKESVGCQDQIMAANGGLCKVEFQENGEIPISRIIMRKERERDFHAHLLLFFTGFSRIASEIAREQIKRTGSLKSELTALYEMVDEGISGLTGESDLLEFGKLLHESWMIKRRLTPKISTQEIDDFYSTARRAGAIGGKLLGAGGGGFMLLFARPEDHKNIIEKLVKFLHVPFNFESEGSQIILRHY